MIKIKSIILFIAWVLVGNNELKAQEEFIQKPAKLITQFKFTQLSGGIVIIRATVDDIKDSLNFILDTGSGGISLDSNLVERLGFIKKPSESTIRGIAGIKQVEFTHKHRLNLPGLSLDSLSFHINDYDILSSVYGIPVDGIIGFTFLRRYIVGINYDSLTISVYTPGGYKYPKGGHLMQPLFSALPLTNAFVQDNTRTFERFIFDTGAGLCLLLSEDFATDSLVFKKRRKRYVTQAEGLGGKKQMELSAVKQVQIGPYKFRRVPTYVFSDDYNVTNYPLLGGIIGNDLLRRFNLVLNYPQQVIHIKPNTRFFDPFDYSYTGLGIYQDGDKVKVIDIVKGSPGDKAGFKSDDVIFSIDNKITPHIQVVKSLLQNAGGSFPVIVLRDNKPISLKLKIKHILRRK